MVRSGSIDFCRIPIGTPGFVNLLLSSTLSPRRWHDNRIDFWSSFGLASHGRRSSQGNGSVLDTAGCRRPRRNNGFVRLRDNDDVTRGYDEGNL